MRQIARGAGIAVGGIYYHFANKEAIFFALLERRRPDSSIVSGLPELCGEDVVAMVEGAARPIVDQVLADPVFGRLNLIDLQEFGGDTVLRLAIQMIQGMLALFPKNIDWVGGLVDLFLNCALRQGDR